jgi:hypothetical protein
MALNSISQIDVDVDIYIYKYNRLPIIILFSGLTQVDISDVDG